MARRSDVVVRRMRAADLPAALDLLAYWNMAPRPPSPDAPDPERSGMIVENSFVAIADDAVVGVASYILHEDRSAETASLAVAPAWLGSFVGEQLQDTRLAEMQARGVERVRTESDRSEIVEWYVRKYGYRVVGSARKKHSFGLAHVDHWTVLELDLRAWKKRTT